MHRLIIIAICLLGFSATAQTTVTLNGSTYTLKSPPFIYFDGSGGVIDTGVKYNSGLPPKAISGNPPWVGLVSENAAINSSHPYTNLNYIDLYEGGYFTASMAMQCYSDATQTAYCNAALDMLNHIEQYFPIFCDENQNDCVSQGTTGYYTTEYGIVYWMHEWIFAYELMQSQMTTPQQVAFADKMLNDLSTAGGISGSPSTSCTNPTANTGVAITISSSTITSASALFGAGNPIQVGYWISMDSGAGYDLAKIVSVIDPTHATISSNLASLWAGYTGTISYRRNTWVAGDCGILWVVKHARFSPRIMSWGGGHSLYPSSGPIFNNFFAGGDFQDYTSNNTYADYPGYMAAFMATTANDANASQRSQPELTAVYNDWFTHVYSAYVNKDWTGFHTAGQAYGTDRPPKMAMMNWIFQNSLTAPPALGGLWDKNLLYHTIMNMTPGCQTAEPSWGGSYSADTGEMSSLKLSFFVPISFLYRNTNEGKWFNYAMRNRISVCTSVGSTPGTNLVWTSGNLAGGTTITEAQWIYAFTDPAFTATDIAVSGPTATLLNQTDATGGFPQSVLMSRTGYNGITDTLVNIFGLGENGDDHNQPAGLWYPGDYRITKGNALLGGDGPDNHTYSAIYNEYSNGGQWSNYMEIGGAYNIPQSSSIPLNSKIPRGNSDGTANRYAYAMADSSLSYFSAVGATRVQRHLVDFKEGQQFVIVYDDVVTTGGQEKQAYLQYPNNFGASSDTARGVTVVTGNSIVSTNPGTGHGDATQLLTTVLAPAGVSSVRVYTNNSDGSFSGGNGETFRVSVCASVTGSSCDAGNTEGEFIVVHEPIAGSGNTPPTMGLISAIDANHRGVEVDGSSPKVALFPRGGSTYTASTFTTAHSGTAQYIVTGLTPGTYNVTVGGSPVVSGTSVAANDNSLYFESTSGLISVQLQGGPAGTPNVSSSGSIKVVGSVNIP